MNSPKIIREVTGFTVGMTGPPIPARHPYRTKLVGVDYSGVFDGESVLLSGSLSVRPGGRPVQETPLNHGLFALPDDMSYEQYATMVHEQVLVGLAESNFPIRALNRGIELRILREQE